MSLELIIVTGQSGSGKSTAVRALEDHGFYVVDNLPTSLVDSLLDTLDVNGSSKRLALVFDARNLRSLEEAPTLVNELRSRFDSFRLLYLEAHETTLLRRYSETRRLHPLDDGCGLKAALGAERNLLTPLRELADDHLDTSEMTPHVLRAKIGEMVAGPEPLDTLRVQVESFGFKHGVPLDADTILDVRFLPNPYFIGELRDHTGLDDDVYQFVLEKDEAQTFVDKIDQLLEFLLPQYRKEGKRYFTLAIGCTGGRHRSVSIARRLSELLEARGCAVDLRHRDVRGKQ